MKKLQRWILPGIDDVIFIMIFLLVLAGASRLLNSDGDLGRHITIGRFIMQQGMIPTQDMFSHTMIGVPLTPHEWLVQVIFYGLHDLLGLSGVVWFSGVIIALTFQQVYRLAVLQGAQRLPAIGLTLIAAIASSIHWLARPHILTFLLLAVWAGKLSHLQRMRTRDLWVFPVTMLVWVNVHGGFIAGFVTWGAFFAGAIWEKFTSGTGDERIKRLALVGAVSFAVSFINPAGWHLWETSLGYIQNRYLVGITHEYQSPDFHQTWFAPFLLFLALAFFILSRKRKSLPVHSALLLSGWTMMALYSARNIPLMAIVAVPILAPILDLREGGRLERILQGVENTIRSGFWSVLTAACVLAFLGVGIMPGAAHKYDPDIFPVAAVNWMEENPQDGNVFNYFTWGGYLLYRLYPSTPVFIDGQTDFYGEALTREYEKVITVQPGWERVLTRYHVEWVIIPSELDLVLALQEQDWQPVYQDSTAAIFRKAD